MENFDDIISEVYTLWEIQKAKSAESLRLEEESEEIEKLMYDLLNKANELDPEAFQKFLDTFAVAKSEREGLIF